MMNELPISLIHVFGVLSVAVLALSVFCVTRLIAVKQHRAAAAFFSPCVLISVFMCLYFDDVITGMEGVIPLSKLTGFIGTLPWSVVIYVMSLCALSAVIAAVLTYRAAHSPVYASLQKGLDGMPDGIYCRDERGETVLINRKMKETAKRAFINGVRDLPFITGDFKSRLKDGCTIEKDGDITCLKLDDGKVLDIRSGRIKTEGGVFFECIAYDITEQYNKSLEIKKRNAHLRKVNGKIRKYSKEMDSMIRDRELLDAKIKIHDDMGRALLSLRSYLSRQERDREALTTLWRVTVSVFRCETAPDRSADRMEALTEAAEAVGVTLHFDGSIPDNADASEITAAAVRECLTNTVKHANGRNLYIKTDEYEGIYTINIRNDGVPPDKPIVETGGLGTLRKAVKRCGGDMQTEWEDGFGLTIKIDLYKENDDEQI